MFYLQPAWPFSPGVPTYRLLPYQVSPDTEVEKHASDKWFTVPVVLGGHETWL